MCCAVLRHPRHAVQADNMSALATQLAKNGYLVRASTENPAQAQANYTYRR